jgi:predicted O-methyltransferase YrrM
LRKPPSTTNIENSIYQGASLKRPSKWWLQHININRTDNLKYLEIGVLYGIHLFEVARLLPNATLYAVDPWIDYEEYYEYKTEQARIWNTFQHNLVVCPDKSRINVHRGLSDEVVPRFDNNSFDIVYVDGNHATEYVYRDGCMALEKLKSGGYIIFDDSDWDITAEGIQKFLDVHKNKLNILGGISWY